VNSNRNKGVIIMGTEEKNDTNNNGTPESNKKTQLISPELKEVTEFLSDIFPVLGAVYAIAFVLFQNKYCQDAENFYKIDSIHFLVDNIQRILIPLSLLAIYLILLFIFKLHLIKVNKINKAYIVNCFINILAAIIFTLGVWVFVSGIIKNILFGLALVILTMEFFCIIAYLIIFNRKDYMQNNLKHNLENKNKGKQVSILKCVIEMLAAIIFMFGVWFFLSGDIKSILFVLALVILIMEIFCNIVYPLILFIEKNIVYKILQMRVPKCKQKKQGFDSSCFNIIAIVISILGMCYFSSGNIKVILFCIAFLFLFISFINIIKDNIQNDLFKNFRDFLCLIFIFLGGVFIFLNKINNNSFFQTKKYEIINKGNTVSCSTIPMVEVVILHKGSQIITQCGEINDMDLTIYTDKYTIKESNSYEYTLKKFNNVVSNSNMPEQ
jgi:membrane protein